MKKYSRTSEYIEFGDSDGYDSPLYNMYNIMDIADFGSTINAIINEVNDRCNNLNLSGIYKTTYVLISSTKDFNQIMNEKKIAVYCRDNRVHVLNGSWKKHFDLFDNTTYFLSFEEYPGSVDDAATYCNISRIKYELRPYLTDELPDTYSFDTQEAERAYYYSFRKSVREFLTYRYIEQFVESDINTWINELGYDLFWLDREGDILKTIYDYYLIVESCGSDRKKLRECAPIFEKARLMLICDISQVEGAYEEIKELCAEKGAHVVGLDESGTIRDHITGQKWTLDCSERRESYGLLCRVIRFVSE